MCAVTTHQLKVRRTRLYAYYNEYSKTLIANEEKSTGTKKEGISKTQTSKIYPLKCMLTRKINHSYNAEHVHTSTHIEI